MLTDTQYSRVTVTTQVIKPMEASDVTEAAARTQAQSGKDGKQLHTHETGSLTKLLPQDTRRRGRDCHANAQNDQYGKSKSLGLLGRGRGTKDRSWLRCRLRYRPSWRDLSEPPRAFGKAAQFGVLIHEAATKSNSTILEKQPRHHYRCHGIVSSRTCGQVLRTTATVARGLKVQDVL